MAWVFERLLAATAVTVALCGCVIPMQQLAQVQRQANERVRQFEEMARLNRLGRFDEAEKIGGSLGFAAAFRDLYQDYDIDDEALFVRPLWDQVFALDYGSITALPEDVRAMLVRRPDEGTWPQERARRKQALERVLASAAQAQQWVVREQLGLNEEGGGDLNAALQHYRAGYELAARSGTASWRAIFLSHEAEVLVALKRPDEALPAVERAQALVDPADAPDAIAALNNVGVVLHHKGDVAGALRAYESAYQRLQAPSKPAEDAAAGGKPSSYLETERLRWRQPALLSNIGLAQWQLGNAVAALASFRSALDARAEFLPDGSIPGQSEGAALARAATLVEELHSIVTLERQAGAAGDPLGLQFLLERKGLLLDRQASAMAEVRQTVEPRNKSEPSLGERLGAMFGSTAAMSREVQQHWSDRARTENRDLLEQYQLVLTQLAQVRSQQPLTPEEAQARERRVADLEMQRRVMQSQIDQRAMVAQVPPQVTQPGGEGVLAHFNDKRDAAKQQRRRLAASVRELIPEGAALVEMLLYKPLDLSQGVSAEPRHAPSRYGAYVMRRGVAPVYVDLGEAERVDSLIAKLRKALATPKSVSAARDIGRQLDERLMVPVRRAAGDATTFLVAPEGNLNLIPFGALVDESGRFLIERFGFNYLASGRDLLRPRAGARPRSPPLIVADASFGANQPAAAAPAQAAGGQRSRDFSGLQFQALPGTAREATAIKRVVPDAILLTGERATESAIKQVRAPRLLHLATHGFFLEEQRSPVGQQPAQPQEDPMLRSGLVFAGANARRSGDEDGVLTALEAIGLDLAGTQLVVLSACETGLGDVRNGEGVFGLRRALVIAGAQTLVMSLWEVDDDTTQRLMSDYYARLARGDGRAEGLLRAQLALIAEPRLSHPFFWASFIASGETGPLH
jgi:CHAT domain-containing protein